MHSLAVGNPQREQQYSTGAKDDEISAHGGDSTVQDALALQQLESIIERGLETYIEVGQALEEIRSRRLYRERGYDTFEDYCSACWGMARRTAYNYIEASTAAANVRTSAQIEPGFHQAVALAPLGPDQQREVAGRMDFSTATVREVREAARAVQKPRLTVHFSSRSEEWYTPRHVVDRVVRALGGIDLDPCSEAARNIPATVHYTREHDGLSRPWDGRVYMNPPYGRSIDPWIEKLCVEFDSGRVTEAIALVPARVDTDWFNRFHDAAVCFIDGRLKFSGRDNSAPFPSAVVYLGSRLRSFREAFREMGRIWVCLEDSADEMAPGSGSGLRVVASSETAHPEPGTNASLIDDETTLEGAAELQSLLDDCGVRHLPGQIRSLIEAGRARGLAMRGILAFVANKLKDKQDRNDPVYSVKLLIRAISDDADFSRWARTASRTRSYFEESHHRRAETEDTNAAVRAHLLIRAKQLRQVGNYEEIAAKIDQIVSHASALTDPEQVEQRLLTLEERMTVLARSRLTAEETSQIRENASATCAPWRGKMTAAQIDMLVRQYCTKLLLERVGLPRLSLFYMRKNRSRAA